MEYMQLVLRAPGLAVEPDAPAVAAGALDAGAVPAQGGGSYTFPCSMHARQSAIMEAAGQRLRKAAAHVARRLRMHAGKPAGPRLGRSACLKACAP